VGGRLSEVTKVSVESLAEVGDKLRRELQCLDWDWLMLMLMPVVLQVEAMM
jgi:hypothetical protein